MARFVAIGELKLNAVDSQNPPIRTNKAGASFEYKTFSATLETANNNRAFLELFGGKAKDGIIKTKDSDNNDIEISVNDVDDESVIGEVANYKKHYINLGIDGEDTKEFIYDYQAVEYLESKLDLINGKRFKITGQVTKNIYKGKVTDRFQIQNIYPASDDVKNMFRITDTFYWNSESLDVEDFNEDKKVYMNGYVETYINKKLLGEDSGANKYVAQQVVLDCSKLDFENEKHMKLLDFKLMGIGLKRDPKTNKISNAIKKNNYYKQQIEFNYFNGSEVVGWDESQLNDWQKTQIELGLKTADDFKPSGTSFGPRVTEYKIYSYSARTGSEFEEGYVDTELTDSEFEEDIFYEKEQEESIDEIIENSTESVSTESDNSVEDLDDLFS